MIILILINQKFDIFLILYFKFTFINFDFTHTLSDALYYIKEHT